MAERRARIAKVSAFAFLAALPLIVFGSCLLGGRAFLPIDLLSYVGPWSHYPVAKSIPPWNVLRFDGVAQFYPWRLQAARSFHRGALPLWNPYEFGASGGSPLWANSQSAPLYPINYLFYVFPIGSLSYVFGLVAAIQLEIAAAGTYAFLRRCMNLGRIPALLGAATFTLSGPVTCWLALPTFLSVSCWIPWLLMLIHASHTELSSRRTASFTCGAGIVAGLIILGGHLQIALYSLSLALGYSGFCWFTKSSGDGHTRRYGGYASAVAAVVAIALCMAAPQVLPAVELSRVSHRAATGSPTWLGYESYISNALPIRNLVTLLFPNFFGHPNGSDPIYWNGNNYAEWAMYAGVAPLLLSCFCLGLPWSRRLLQLNASWTHNDRVFFAAIAVLSLLLAAGAPINIPLFFLLPGYSQTGNPGRVLVVFAFAVAVLASIGLEVLLSVQITKETRERATIVAVSAPAILAAIGASRAAAYFRESTLGSSLGAQLTPVMPSIYFGCAVFILAAILIVVVGITKRTAAGVAIVVLTTFELVYWGWGYNPTSTADGLYRVTPGIEFLQRNADDSDLVAPINRNWSLSGRGPRNSTLPPNALTVFGLHDLGGYDSLFVRDAKEKIRDAGDGIDPSPPENGNMVFVKNVDIAKRLGARFIVVSPDEPLDDLPPTMHLAYDGPDLIIYENASPVRFNKAVGADYAPASLRFGLFAWLEILSILASIATYLAASRLAKRRPQRAS